MLIQSLVSFEITLVTNYHCIILHCIINNTRYIYHIYIILSCYLSFIKANCSWCVINCIYILPNSASRICRAICDDSWAPERSARHCSPPWTWCNWSMILIRGFPKIPRRKNTKRRRLVTEMVLIDAVSSFLVENERLLFWILLAQIVIVSSPFANLFPRYPPFLPDIHIQ